MFNIFIDSYGFVFKKRRFLSICSPRNFMGAPMLSPKPINDMYQDVKTNSGIDRKIIKE